MAQSPRPQPETRVAQVVKATPDYVVASQKADTAVLTAVEKNPIYRLIFSDTTQEQRIAQIDEALSAGLEDGTAKDEQFDERSRQLLELNAAIQAIRKKLGLEEADAITSKDHANLQEILRETRDDVAIFEEGLAPLARLSELFAKFGVEGNIIEKLNQAIEQKRLREERLAEWSSAQDSEVYEFRKAISALESQIVIDQRTLDDAWIGKAKLQAKIANAKADLETRKQQLAEVLARQPDIAPASDSDISQVDEEILELQDIGGEKFKSAVVSLKDNTHQGLAKMSLNFDKAITSLINSRESFLAMDRNCGDAILVLTVLQVAVKQAEEKARKIAEAIIAKDAIPADPQDKMAEIARMERQQRSDQILTYTSSLTAFLSNLTVAVGSLRQGQAGIKSILRMNAAALESANTYKITGMANCADAVTQIIGSIIDVNNRAAGRVLSDGLDRILGLSQEGSARLAGGQYEALRQRNEQWQSFIDSLENLRSQQQAISLNSVEALKQSFELVEKMQRESHALGETTRDAERTEFAARAGVVTETKPDEPQPTERRGFGLRMPH